MGKFVDKLPQGAVKVEREPSESGKVADLLISEKNRFYEEEVSKVKGLSKALTIRHHKLIRYKVPQNDKTVYLKAEPMSPDELKAYEKEKANRENARKK